MKSGFTMVFGGKAFDPDAFVAATGCFREEAAFIRRGDQLPEEIIAEDSWIEFSDIHEGSHPLDPACEALDLLLSRKNCFLELARFPGVEFRTFNIFGDAASCTLVLDPEDIALLSELQMTLSVVPC